MIKFTPDLQKMRCIRVEFPQTKFSNNFSNTFWSVCFFKTNNCKFDIIDWKILSKRVLDHLKMMRVWVYFVWSINSFVYIFPSSSLCIFRFHFHCFFVVAEWGNLRYIQIKFTYITFLMVVCLFFVALKLNNNDVLKYLYIYVPFWHKRLLNTDTFPNLSYSILSYNLAN